MILSPEGIEDKIGLARIRARIRQHSLSKAAARAVGELQPVADRSQAAHRLRISSELTECVSGPDPIPLDAVEDIVPVLRAAKPLGAALPAEAILSVLHAARTARLVRSFVHSRADHFPTTADVWSELKVTRDLEDAVGNVFDPDGRVKDSASPELKKIRRDLHGTRESLRARMTSLLARAVSSGYAAEDQATIRAGRMVIPVTASAKRKVDGFVHDVSATGQTVYIEPRECLELNNDIRELELAEAREIERIRRLLTDLIREHAADLASNVDLLIRFDVALAVARLAKEMNAIVPPLNEDGIIRIVGGRNPELLLVYRSQGRGGDVVPLDIEVGDSFHTLVISGPNAGGKSIAMKTVGLMAAMLGMGIPIPVSEESTFQLFGGIFVDIGDAQSVEDDLSTYSSHLRNLGIMLQRADGNTLVLIDEAGTGTDPEEGAALAQAVLETLAKRGARTIVTTHHGGLKAYAHDADLVANGSMSFDINTLKPTFEFRLNVPGASYAAEIAMKVGLQKDVISRARELMGSDKVRMETLVVSLEASNRELDNRLSEARKMMLKAESDRASIQNRLASLQEERDTIQRNAVEEAERILNRANSTVERVVREIRESAADTSQTRAARALLEKEKAGLKRDAERLKKRAAARNKKVATSTGSGQAPTNIRSRTKQEAGALKSGDFVFIEGADTVGQILSLKGSEAVVRLGDLQSRVPLTRLHKRGGPPEQKVTIRHAQRAGDRLAGVDLQQRIDIRGCRVDEALSKIVSFVDEAYAASLDRVEILHGKGTGALRQAVQEYLDASEQVSRLEEAPLNEGGAGVTIAWLNS